MVLIFFDPLKRGFIPWEVFTVMLSALSVWQNSLDEIKRSMTPLSYNTWVATMTPICIKAVSYTHLTLPTTERV